VSGATLSEERLDSVFAALADPTRRAIVRRLAEGDATVNELAAPFAMSLPGISKHLKVLERSGLITRGRSAQFRPCHLEVATLDSTVEWLAQQRELWGDRFDQLDQHLQVVQRAARAVGEGADHG
jgi:DNA-binding transcriptional ArsR family regulator